MFLIIAIVVIAIIIIATGAYVVPQQRAFIIERLGKFHTISTAGFHVKIPIIDNIVGKIDLRTMQSDFEINAKTRDNVTIRMDIASQYCVDSSGAINSAQSGVYRSFYLLSNPVTQMTSYIADALRSSIPNYNLDEVFEKKENIAVDVNQTVAGLMNQYGYNVVTTLIVNIHLPKDVEASMNDINTAQRKQAAAQALAEAERVKVVTGARAEAEKMELQGQGIARQRKAIAEGIKESIDTIRESGVSEQEANLLFMYTQYCDMMTAFAQKGTGTSTVVLPSDFRETSSMFEQMLAANDERFKRE